MSRKKKTKSILAVRTRISTQFGLKMPCKYIDKDKNCIAIMKIEISEEQLKNYCQTEKFTECPRHQFITNRDSK